MAKDWDDREKDLGNPFGVFEKIINNAMNKPIRHKIIMDLTVDELYSVMEFMSKNNIGRVMFKNEP